MKHSPKTIVAALLGTLIAAISATPAAGDDVYQAYLRAVLKSASAVKVIIQDHVKGGCWPNPNTSKVYFEGQLLDNAVPVKDDALLDVELVLSGNPIKNANVTLGCAVFVFAQAEHKATVSMPESNQNVAGVARSWQVGRMLIGPKAGSQELIDDTLKDFAAHFAVLWKKARQ